MLAIPHLIRLLARQFARKFLRLKIPYSYAPLFDYFHYTGKKLDKRALLSYRALHLRERSRFTWSSGGDAHDIIQVLSELGYKTDIVFYDDTSFEPKRKYDIFIATSSKNFSKLDASLPKNIPRILYATASYWRFQNAQEDQRIEELYKKTGVKINAERRLDIPEDEIINKVNGIILLGNKTCAETYPSKIRNKIRYLNGASYIDKPRVDLNKKDFVEARNNFIFMGGSGNAHKRLDIILEAFKEMPDKNIYICTKLEDEFSKTYHKELFETPNIHYVGHIRLYTKKFISLNEKCIALVFPSVSEGSPGSVADLMIQGTIPLVSKESHIDIVGSGEYIEPCTKERIQSLVKEYSSKSPQWLKQKSLDIQAEALTQFDPSLFRQKFKKYLREIICSKNG